MCLCAGNKKEKEEKRVEAFPGKQTLKPSDSTRHAQRRGSVLDGVFCGGGGNNDGADGRDIRHGKSAHGKVGR